MKTHQDLSMSDFVVWIEMPACKVAQKNDAKNSTLGRQFMGTVILDIEG
jgi:hypothetical protein